MPSGHPTAARRDPAPTVTVTVVLYNSEEALAACLDSIRPELTSGFAELIAVDNDSPDHSVAVLQHQVPDATVLRSGANRGFAAGANQAWPHVRGRYWPAASSRRHVRRAALALQRHSRWRCNSDMG